MIMSSVLLPSVRHLSPSALTWLEMMYEKNSFTKTQHKELHFLLLSLVSFIPSVAKVYTQGYEFSPSNPRGRRREGKVI